MSHRSSTSLQLFKVGHRIYQSQNLSIRREMSDKLRQGVRVVKRHPKLIAATILGVKCGVPYLLCSALLTPYTVPDYGYVDEFKADREELYRQARLETSGDPCQYLASIIRTSQLLTLSLNAAISTLKSKGMEITLDSLRQLPKTI